MITLVTAFSILILRLPVLLGGDNPSTRQSVIFLLPLLVAGTVRFVGAGTPRPAPPRLTIFAVYLLLIVVAGWRGIGADTGYSSHQWKIDALTLCSVAFYGYAVFVRDGDDARVRKQLLALCFAPGIYIGANVLLRSIGVSSGDRVPPPEAHDPDRMLRFFGISHLRTLFPLGVGVNTFGITVGVAVCACLILALRTQGRVRVAALGLGVLSVIAILLADSRGPLLAALGAAGVVALLGKRFGRRVNRLALLIPLSPAIVFGALSLLSHSALTVDAQGSGALATGTTRLFVWQPIVNVLRHVSADRFLGLGAYGHIRSGAYLQYEFLFSGYHYVPAAHNFVLQSALDIGYIGLAVSIALFVVVIRAFADATRAGSAAGATLLASALYLVLVGFTEAAPTVYSPEALFFFLLLALAASRWSPPDSSNTHAHA
jgi:O-antigen ligase